MSNSIQHTPGQQVSMPTGYTGLRVIATVAHVLNGYVHARVDGIERSGIPVGAEGLVQVGAMRCERSEHCFAITQATSPT